MPKKTDKDIIVPKDAMSFLENGEKTGFKGLIGFKNLVELIKNESRKIQGISDLEPSIDRLMTISQGDFDKKITPESIEKIASCYGYYFYHFLNSSQSPLSVEEVKAVCFYRVVTKVDDVAILLEIDKSVCLKLIKKGVRILLLSSTFSLFLAWIQNVDENSDLLNIQGSTLANAPIANLKQYLPKSLVFTLSTKGDTLAQIFSKHKLEEVKKFKGMGKSKFELLVSFLSENNLDHLFK